MRVSIGARRTRDKRGFFFNDINPISHAWGRERAAGMIFESEYQPILSAFIVYDSCNAGTDGINNKAAGFFPAALL